MAMYLGKQRVAILSQKYTTEKFSFRKTPDFGGLSQSTLFRVKKIKGSTVKTVKSKNLIPYPYYDFNNKGTNEIYVSGVTYTSKSDGSIVINGTAENTPKTVAIARKLEIKENTTFSFSNGISDLQDDEIVLCMLQFYDENGAYIDGYGSFGADVLIRPSDKKRYIDITVHVDSEKTANNITIYPMLNEGETALSYQPYITVLKHAHINSIKSTGKNLIPYPFYPTDNIVAGITFTDNGDGTISVNGTATEYASFIVFRDVLKAGTYYLSGCNNAGNNLIELYFATPDFRIYKVDYGNGVRIDLPHDEIIMIVINLQPNAVADNLVFKPMLNYGSTALSFEPYKEDTWQLSETLELGEWDELNPSTGEVKRATERIVFDGTETWGVGGAASGKYRIRLSGIALSTGPMTNTSAVPNIICNHYETTSGDNTYMLKEGICTQGPNLYLYDPDFNTSDISLWKAHLAELYANGNPLTVAYEKVEPTIEKVESCHLAYTAFKGGTETVIQGEEDNSQFGAIPTIETGHTVMMEIIGDKYD